VLGTITCAEEELKLAHYLYARLVGHTFWISWMGTALAGIYVGLGSTNQALLLAEQYVALDSARVFHCLWRILGTFTGY
jgi:hypothetical protein